jgi:hypothetical protein
LEQGISEFYLEADAQASHDGQPLSYSSTSNAAVLSTLWLTAEGSHHAKKRLLLIEYSNGVDLLTIRTGANRRNCERLAISR